MKSLARLVSLFILTVSLTALASAASKNAGKFTLPNTVRVGSTDLHPGEYKVEWTEATAGTLKVEISQNGKNVVTTEGKLKDLPERSPYDAVITKPLSDNVKGIDEIDFSNRKQALVLAE